METHKETINRNKKTYLQIICKMSSTLWTDCVGTSRCKTWELKKNFTKIYNKFGKRYEHTNRRLFENNILNLQDE
jgi:hypothetical protein